MSKLNRKERDILLPWAQGFSIHLSGFQIHQIGTYIDELCDWNKRINLTGVSSRERIFKELLLDSMIPASFLPERGNLLDVGSGAGFPAIPLKICKRGLSFHLIEARSKKVNFLKQVVRLIRLKGIEIIRGRIEKDKSLLRAEGYHVITARAFAHLPQTLTWCSLCLVPGGMIVSFQGSRFMRDLKESSNVMKKERLFLCKSIPYVLPGKNRKRHILVFKKREL